MGEFFVSVTGIIQVLVAFGLLIFVHELGHFIVAKLVGVRVEEFCLGFGPKLASYRKGQTLYGLCWVPLGGYVKMAGQRDFQADQGITGAPDEYTSKSPLARACIIFAGPVMNLVFAFGVLVIGFAVGIEFIPPVVGELIEELPAYQAGLRTDDRVISVGGTEVERFDDISRAVAFNWTKGEAGGTIKIVVRRKGVAEPIDLVMPVRQDAQHPIPIIEGLALPTHRVRIGCELHKAIAVTGVLEGSPAQEAGITAGDLLLEANGQKLDLTTKLQEMVKASAGTPVELRVRRGEEEFSLSMTPRVDPGVDVPRIGVEMLPVSINTDTIKSVTPGGPAEAAGIRPGDRVRAMTIRKDKTVAIAWDRGGAPAGEATLEQMPEGSASPVLVMDKLLRVPEPVPFPAAMGRAAAEVVGIVRETFLVLFRVLTRSFSPKIFLGPVSIARYTYLATEPGLGHYLWFVAVISTNLGVINVLPIPVLDGGHMIFIAAESVRGKPLNRRIIEYSQVVGLVMILALVIFVTFNDVRRIFW